VGSKGAGDASRCTLGLGTAFGATLGTALGTNFSFFCFSRTGSTTSTTSTVGGNGLTLLGAPFGLPLERGVSGSGSGAGSGVGSAGVSTGSQTTSISYICNIIILVRQYFEYFAI
jgi:hypothetical protein